MTRKRWNLERRRGEYDLILKARLQKGDAKSGMLRKLHADCGKEKIFKKRNSIELKGPREEKSDETSYYQNFRDA